MIWVVKNMFDMFTLKETLFMVSHFAKHGNLKSYLLTTHGQGDYANVVSNSNCLRDIVIAEQVADGMLYLRGLSEVFLRSLESKTLLLSIQNTML